jgi:hypothetical protein
LAVSYYGLPLDNGEFVRFDLQETIDHSECDKEIDYGLTQVLSDDDQREWTWFYQG